MFSYYHCILTISIIIVFVYSVLTSIICILIFQNADGLVSRLFLYHIFVLFFLSPVSWLPLYPRSPLSWYYRVKINSFTFFLETFIWKYGLNFFFLMVLPWGYRNPSFWKIMSIMGFPRFRLMKSRSLDWKKK